ncbi:MAG: hypothetical protein SGBAC_011458 [Bacillariaceae sp.]
MLTKLLLLLTAVINLTPVTSFQPTGTIRGLYGNPMKKLCSKAVKDEESSEMLPPTTTIYKEGEDIYLKTGANLGSNKPNSAFLLGFNNFAKQSKAISVQLLARLGLVKEDKNPEYLPPQSLGLTLSNEAVKEAELSREAREGRVETNQVSGVLYSVGCFALDELFTERPIARFWFLETIARIPYFSYASMLHLYESFGWWRGIQLRKVHNAEEYNELHHLL